MIDLHTLACVNEVRSAHGIPPLSANYADAILERWSAVAPASLHWDE